LSREGNLQERKKIRKKNNEKTEHDFKTCLFIVHLLHFFIYQSDIMPRDCKICNKTPQAHSLMPQTSAPPREKWSVSRGFAYAQSVRQSIFARGAGCFQSSETTMKLRIKKRFMNELGSGTQRKTVTEGALWEAPALFRGKALV